MDKNPLADFEVGNMSESNYNTFDLHKHVVDKITLVSPSGKPMKREADLIDVWFDSGSMPYAQWHYPFENKELVEGYSGQADFIAEGVDQTRGWFFTLHAIATMCFDRVAYKNVISNGLVLDKNGQKMSKRLGNGVDPFETLAKYGPDATRWYMITNAQPWDNLKFDIEGIVETQRKFFGTLYNTYSFFALYANIDEFTYEEKDIALKNRPEIDQWVLSKLNTLISNVKDAYESYEPTKAGRLIQDFTIDQLSNWYVRLCRRRFWKGDYAEDKISAYQTLYTCLKTVAQLASPIAPFFTEQLFSDLNNVTNQHDVESVHLSIFPTADKDLINSNLEEKVDIAQQITSMVLSLRQTNKLKVRQPLQKIMVPVLNEKFEEQLLDVKELILSEVNVKELEILKDTSGVLVKKIKPNFKTIGPKYGKHMKAIAAMVNSWGSDEIAKIEAEKGWNGEVNGENISLELSDFEISTDDIPGWLITTQGELTVALDVTITEDLKNEGISRELVNRIQNLRKDSDFEVTDRINIKLKGANKLSEAIANNKQYICNETLANGIDFVEELDEKSSTKIDFDKDISIFVAVEKMN